METLTQNSLSEGDLLNLELEKDIKNNPINDLDFITTKTLKRLLKDVIVNGMYQDLFFYEYLIARKKEGVQITKERAKNWHPAFPVYEYKIGNYKTPKITEKIKEYFESIYFI